MNWKQYEAEILEYFQKTYPGAKVSYDQKIIGKLSKTERQVDILIEGNVAGFPIKIAVDCKFYKKKLDVKDVDAFASMLDDLDVHQGILITNTGYSSAAIDRAFNGSQKLELDIINFDEIKANQGFVALPYVGNFGILIQAPFGWVIDLSEEVIERPILFQRGSSAKEAFKRPEVIYFEIHELPSSDHPEETIDELIDVHHQNMLSKVPDARLSVHSLTRADRRISKLRISHLDNNLLPHLDVAGYVHLGSHIFVVHLLTPLQLLIKNQRKLELLLSSIKIAHIKFENGEKIRRENTALLAASSDDERASIHFNLGKLYLQMEKSEDALIHYKKCIEHAPKNYDFLRRAISEELKAKDFEGAIHHSELLFDLGPDNPTIYQDLTAIFGKRGEISRLIEFLELKEKIRTDDESLGNINLTLGNISIVRGQKDNAYSYFRKAKKHLEKVLPADHYLFNDFKEYGF